MLPWGLTWRIKYECTHNIVNIPETCKDEKLTKEFKATHFSFNVLC